MLCDLISDFHQNKDWNHYFGKSLSRSDNYLISDFHQNKDWNNPLPALPNLSMAIWFLISTKTRIETGCKHYAPDRWDFIWFLISTKTRIETDNSFQKQTIIIHIWFLISTKTRIETLLKLPVESFFFLFDFWFPPKQGLKHFPISTPFTLYM